MAAGCTCGKTAGGRRFSGPDRAVLTGLDLPPRRWEASWPQVRSSRRSWRALWSSMPSRPGGRAGQVTEFTGPDRGECGGFGWDLTVAGCPLTTPLARLQELQRALEELSAWNGTVSGTLHLLPRGSPRLAAGPAPAGDETASPPPRSNGLALAQPKPPRRRPKSACPQTVGW